MLSKAPPRAESATRSAAASISGELGTLGKSRTRSRGESARRLRGRQSGDTDSRLHDRERALQKVCAAANEPWVLGAPGASA